MAGRLSFRNCVAPSGVLLPYSWAVVRGLPDIAIVPIGERLNAIQTNRPQTNVNANFSEGFELKSVFVVEAGEGVVSFFGCCVGCGSRATARKHIVVANQTI